MWDLVIKVFVGVTLVAFLICRTIAKKKEDNTLGTDEAPAPPSLGQNIKRTIRSMGTHNHTHKTCHRK